MEGFVGFSDVQVADSIIFCFVFCGFILGVLFSDGFHFFVKWFIKRIK